MQKKKMEKKIRRVRKKLRRLYGNYINTFFKINKEIDKKLGDNLKARECLREIYIKYGEEALNLAKKIDKYLEEIENAKRNR